MVTAMKDIEHVEAPIALLRNGRRLLKPGGYMVIKLGDHQLVLKTKEA